MVPSDSPVAAATAWSSWAWVMGGFLRWSESDPGAARHAHGGPEVAWGDGCGRRSRYRWTGHTPGATVGVARPGRRLPIAAGPPGSRPEGSGRRREPVRLQPGPLGLQGLAAAVEGAEHRPADRAGGRPCQRPSGVGLDVAGAGDRRAAERGQVDRLAVDGRARCRGRSTTRCITPPPASVACRRMRRRGRSTSIASSADCTCASCAATRWRSALAVAQVLRADARAPPAGPARPARRAARCERTFSSRNRPKNSDRLSTAESRKTLRLAVLARAGDPLGQVRDQPGELLEERLLGQLHRLLEPRRHAGPLLLVDGRAELQQVVGRLDAGEVPGDGEQARPASRGSRPGCRASPSRSAAARFSSP